MATLSLQLYTLRDQFASDRDATLAALATMGLDEVEPFGIEHFEWLPAALAAHGLTAGSAHAGLLTETAKVLDAAQALGVTKVFQPYWEPEKWQAAEGIRELADALNGVVDRAATAGVTVGYHNHDFEFTAPDVDGTPAYDYFVSLLDERVTLEVDTYWAAAGGRDVPTLLASYPDRITHLHVKDGPLEPSRSGAANVVLGTGSMNLAPILDASPDRVWVTEFDFAVVDPIEEVRESIAYLKAR
ncbi:sugar phosphate isomerase/epimerase family protein [Propionicimonas sp.]|uniref:sugar phosphate isomerase/epimerase family protein n=1 Tax=Propionicimonas sp. TaxID=1955623 RepID=UPI0039E6933C